MTPPDSAAVALPAPAAATERAKPDMRLLGLQPTLLTPHTNGHEA